MILSSPRMPKARAISRLPILSACGDPLFGLRAFAGDEGDDFVATRERFGIFLHQVNIGAEEAGVIGILPKGTRLSRKPYRLWNMLLRLGVDGRDKPGQDALVLLRKGAVPA